MKPDREQTQAQLILATIETIEEVGLAKVTVRRLAERAKVNVAAINYYFGSKDRLVEATLAQTMSHMLSDVDEIMQRLEADPTGQLLELMTYLLEGSLRYPKITRAQLHGMFNHDLQDAQLAQRFAPITKQLIHIFQSTVPGLSKPAAQDRAIRTLSGVFFPAFFHGFFAPSKLLETPKSRQRYLISLRDSLFAEA